jgi:hypothetical protein
MSRTLICEQVLRKSSTAAAVVLALWLAGAPGVSQALWWPKPRFINPEPPMMYKVVKESAIAVEETAGTDDKTLGPPSVVTGVLPVEAIDLSAVTSPAELSQPSIHADVVSRIPVGSAVKRDASTPGPVYRKLGEWYRPAGMIAHLFSAPGNAVKAMGAYKKYVVATEVRFEGRFWNKEQVHLAEQRTNRLLHAAFEEVEINKLAAPESLVRALQESAKYCEKPRGVWSYLYSQEFGKINSESPVSVTFRDSNVLGHSSVRIKSANLPSTETDVDIVGWSMSRTEDGGARK